MVFHVLFFASLIPISVDVSSLHKPYLVYEIPLSIPKFSLLLLKPKPPHPWFGSGSIYITYTNAR